MVCRELEELQAVLRKLASSSDSSCRYVAKMKNLSVGLCLGSLLLLVEEATKCLCDSKCNQTKLKYFTRILWLLAWRNGVLELHSIEGGKLYEIRIDVTPLAREISDRYHIGLANEILKLFEEHEQ